MPALNPIGKPFVELLTVESTNNYAMGLARAAMAQHGTVVFAHEQTNGKGQRSREWLSLGDQNIAMSIVIEPEKLSRSGLVSLSMMAAVAVHEFISDHAVEDVRIKWPNDIYWRDRKAAGILIENIWQAGQWKFAVVGIGINVNQVDFRELGTKAVSLKQITGREYEPVALAKQLCAILEAKFSLLVSDASKIVDHYKSHLYKLHDRVKLKKDNRVFEAEFKDVNSEGQMVVLHSMLESFNVGEVEWIIS